MTNRQRDGRDSDGRDINGDSGQDAVASRGAVNGVRPVCEAVKEVDPSPYLELMEQRFGIAREVFDPYVFFKPNKDGLWIVNRDLEAPRRPDAHVVGMPFFRIDMRFPRPSTNAVLKFGGLATRNIAHLADDEIASALYRRSLMLDRSQASRITGNGYVILLYRDRPLGLGYFRPFDKDAPGGTDEPDGTDESRGGGELTAMCPKQWTSKLGLLPPAQRPVPWDTSDSSSSS